MKLNISISAKSEQKAPTTLKQILKSIKESIPKGFSYATKEMTFDQIPFAICDQVSEGKAIKLSYTVISGAVKTGDVTRMTFDAYIDKDMHVWVGDRDYVRLSTTNLGPMVIVKRIEDVYKLMRNKGTEWKKRRKISSENFRYKQWQSNN